MRPAQVRVAGDSRLRTVASVASTPPAPAPYAFPWPLRLLGGLFLAVAVVVTALMVAVTFLLLGFALVAFSLTIAAWVPVPVTAVVLTALIWLGGWAWLRS